MTFAQKVYKFTALIPRGKVATYHSLAVAIGRPSASRSVGNALNKNPFAPQVPCHRVVRSSGEVGGFAGGNAKKIRLLRREGVVIKKSRVASQACFYEFPAQG